MIDIKERIIFLRDAMNMNNNKLAKASGLNPSVLSSLFNRSQEPELSTLRAIIRGLGVSESEFFSEGELYDLTKDQADLLLLYKRLSKENKALAIAIMKAFK